MTDQERTTIRLAMAEVARRATERHVATHGVGPQTQDEVRSAITVAQVAVGAYVGLTPQQSIALGRPSREAYAALIGGGVGELAHAVNQARRVLGF